MLRVSLGAMWETFKPLVVERNGVRLQVRVAGDGPPLLLLHGHPQSMAMWHRVAPTLARNFTTVLVEHRA